MPPPKELLLEENSGFLAMYLRQWFYPLSSYSPLSLPKEPPDQLKQAEGSQLQGCKQTAFTAKP